MTSQRSAGRHYALAFVCLAAAMVCFVRWFLLELTVSDAYAAASAGVPYTSNHLAAYGRVERTAEEWLAGTVVALLVCGSVVVKARRLKIAQQATAEQSQ
jgi:hypothetical protein